jgi:hypothetical protein
VYQECLEIELGFQRILFVARKPLPLEYKGQPLRQTYEPDLICFEKIVVELKAVSVLADEHRAQVINYLNASGCQFGVSSSISGTIRSSNMNASPTPESHRTPRGFDTLAEKK